MLPKTLARKIYLGDHDWHVGRAHFSIADYDDSANVTLGKMITFHDFTLQPCSGFAPHPQQEIEIISDCVNEDPGHEDDIGNNQIDRREEMLSPWAVSGIRQSKRNGSWRKPLRSVQIWPNAAGLSLSHSSTQLKTIRSPQQATANYLRENDKKVAKIIQDAKIFLLN
jgi:redox-sensitive bicupin YhaK (pirin superfamily)